MYLEHSGKDAKFSDIDLTKDGQDDGEPGSKSVKIDPASGKVVQDAMPKKEGKTLSKADKKKKTKKSKKEKKGEIQIEIIVEVKSNKGTWPGERRGGGTTYPLVCRSTHSLA